MDKEIPKKSVREFKIGNEQIEEFKTVSAVTKILAENPHLAEEIAEIFKQVAMERDHELRDRITNLLVKNVPEVSAEQVRASFMHWYLFYFPTEPTRHLYRFSKKPQ